MLHEHENQNIIHNSWIMCSFFCRGCRGQGWQIWRGHLKCHLVNMPKTPKNINVRQFSSSGFAPKYQPKVTIAFNAGISLGKLTWNTKSSKPVIDFWIFQDRVCTLFADGELDFTLCRISNTCCAKLCGLKETLSTEVQVVGKKLRLVLAHIYSCFISHLIAALFAPSMNSYELRAKVSECPYVVTESPSIALCTLPGGVGLPPWVHLPAVQNRHRKKATRSCNKGHAWRPHIQSSIRQTLSCM